MLQQWLAALVAAHSSLTPAAISVYRLKHPTQAIYRSRIASQLARQESWEKLAAELTVGGKHGGSAPTAPLDASNASFLTFAIERGESGWLDFYLSDSSLALWLEQLPARLCQLKQAYQGELKENFDDIWFLQYAHARCCSLLRLGHRQGLIQLLEPTCSQTGWQWQTPESLNWLDGEGKFLLSQPSERHLTLQFLQVADALDSGRGANWRLLAANLSEAVLASERYCRIFGENRQNSRELAQCRLKLFALSQLLLQVLLEEKLGMAALREL